MDAEPDELAVAKSERLTKGAWAGLGAMGAAFFFANIDRYSFVVLLEPIKLDLRATDTQMGFLAGLAFVVCNFLFGIPMARWVDVGVRRTILALSLIAWSIVTGLSSLAGSVFQMGLARAGLGVAESAGLPACLSMIADHFPRASRHRAVALFQACSMLSPALGVPVIALLSQEFGWRMAILIPGVAGLFLGLAIWAFMKEPVRGRFDPPPASSVEAEGLIQAIRTVLGNPPLVCILASHAFAAAAAGVILTWLTPVLMRVHGFSMAAVGALTAGAGVLAIMSGLAGGWFCSWLAGRSRNDRWIAIFSAAACLLAIPATIGWLSTTATAPFVALFFLSQMAIYARIAPVLTLSSELVPPRVRGITAAMMIGCANIIGAGLAPILTGILSDRLSSSLGPAEGIRLALLYTAPLWLALAGACALLAARFMADARPPTGDQMSAVGATAAPFTQKRF